MKILLLSYFLLLLAAGVIGRPGPNSSRNSVSDDEFGKKITKSSVIGFKGKILMNYYSAAEGEEEEEYYDCEQMYGFLPCSKSITGHVFLILVYEYLLFHGESYVASGGRGSSRYSALVCSGLVFFRSLAHFQKLSFFSSSGLLNNKEAAQELVLTGLGLVAGSSILLLTLLWGTCVVLGSQDFPNLLQSRSSSDCIKHNPLEDLFSSLWPGYGVVTDYWTCYTARIMLVSVIPFTIIQFPRILHLSSGWERIFIVATLVVSVTFLISYFFYQLFQPWIQRRQLLYIKHAHLVVDILKHVQNHTMGRLFTNDGAPNLSVIRSIFEETDQDGDNALTAAELKGFIEEIKFRRSHSDKDKVTQELMEELDKNSDRKITVDEFVKGMGKWIEETKQDAGKRYDLNEVLQPWIEKEERELMKNIVPEILEHFQASMQRNLLAEDRTPDIPALKRLFKDIDHDKDDFISYSELSDVMMDIKFRSVPHDTEVVASEVMEELDTSGDRLINEEEFVTGLSKWLNKDYTNQTSMPKENKDSDYQKSWEKTDTLVDDKLVDRSLLAWTKAISLMVLGIVMLGLLAEPLIHSVQNLSTAAKVPSFFIAFIFVPLATNARLATSAISEARRKKVNVTSLTLSEPGRGLAY
ncbi:hypothetical protein OROHE_012797 [Orobanche hederae]